MQAPQGQCIHSCVKLTISVIKRQTQSHSISALQPTQPCDKVRRRGLLLMIKAHHMPIQRPCQRTSASKHASVLRFNAQVCIYACGRACACVRVCAT
eukprot:1159761-Pelagomonas_calceolata.AAC.9